MADTRPRDLLTDDLLVRLGGTPIDGGPSGEGSVGESGVSFGTSGDAREVAHAISRDIGKIRAAGYLTIALPREFGGLGCTLRQAKLR